MGHYLKNGNYHFLKFKSTLIYSCWQIWFLTGYLKNVQGALVIPEVLVGNDCFVKSLKQNTEVPSSSSIGPRNCSKDPAFSLNSFLTLIEQIKDQLIKIQTQWGSQYRMPKNWTKTCLVFKMISHGSSLWVSWTIFDPFSNHNSKRPLHL